MQTLRLFIAAELPTEIKSHIADLIERLKATNADIRWERADKLHITIKFLGDTQENVVPKIILLLDDVALHTSSFSLTYGGVGCFPNQRDPRIIWVGVEDSDGALATLAKAVEDAMASLGFEQEKRRFHAHVTIGRVKGRRNIANLLRTMESTTLDWKTAELSRITLVKSELKPTGSHYTILKEFPFRADSV